MNQVRAGLLLTLLTTRLVVAQPIDKAKLDAYFRALEANNKYMGSVALARNGQMIYTKTTGFADVQPGKKPNDATKYRIGSISKTFTAVLVFKAIDEKKLTLAQPLAAYFPTINNAGEITIGHLLSHRSGIHSFTSDADYLSYNTTKQTQAAMINRIAKGGSDFKPDSKAAYSNANYVLLSYILETIYNKSYAQLLTERITTPLDLANTGYGGPINVAANEANSYKWTGTWQKEPETDPTVPMGAGAILSTPTDLVKFAEALFGGKLVSESSLAQMKTMRDGYGMGLLQLPFGTNISYGHTGGIDGFVSVFGYFPGDKTVFAATSNGTATNTNTVYITLLSAAFNVPYIIPTFNTYAVSPAELEQYVGVYVSPQIPLKITIAKDGANLTGQATGQPAFPLAATAKDQFNFEPAGVVLEFTPASKQMVLKQGGGVYTFTKE